MWHALARRAVHLKRSTSWHHITVGSQYQVKTARRGLKHTKHTCPSIILLACAYNQSINIYFKLHILHCHIVDTKYISDTVWGGTKGMKPVKGATL